MALRGIIEASLTDVAACKGDPVPTQPRWALPTNLDEVFMWAPVRIAFLLVIAIVLRALLHKMITVGVRRVVDSKAQDRKFGALIAAERREQRISALGSMTRAVVTTVIAVVIAIMVFDELGFNVTTIVAGTSVLGVAVAFGLQSIVKDLLSGVFMLIEDQLGVGDFVDMDKASGTVESVGLRVTQLRDDNGNVWYVRNGEVLRVGNFSQGGSGRPITPPAASWTLSYAPATGKPETSAVKAPEEERSPSERPLQERSPSERHSPERPPSERQRVEE
ncbi:hypothetical protein GCM10028815_08590 [Mariniluteicoccus flavus]